MDIYSSYYLSINNMILTVTKNAVTSKLLVNISTYHSDLG